MKEIIKKLIRFVIAFLCTPWMLAWEFLDWLYVKDPGKNNWNAWKRYMTFTSLDKKG